MRYDNKSFHEETNTEVSQRVASRKMRYVSVSDKFMAVYKSRVSIYNNKIFKIFKKYFKILRIQYIKLTGICNCTIIMYDKAIIVKR